MNAINSGCAVKGLVCVNIDLASPKSPSLQLIGFWQTSSPALRVCNFYNGNRTLKNLAGFISPCKISLLCRFDFHRNQKQE